MVTSGRGEGGRDMPALYFPCRTEMMQDFTGR
jgi:hypothetical protein